jgi:hypothetical protein
MVGAVVCAWMLDLLRLRQLRGRRGEGKTACHRIAFACRSVTVSKSLAIEVEWSIEALKLGYHLAVAPLPNVRHPLLLCAIVSDVALSACWGVMKACRCRWWWW